MGISRTVFFCRLPGSLAPAMPEINNRENKLEDSNDIIQHNIRRIRSCNDKNAIDKTSKGQSKNAAPIECNRQRRHMLLQEQKEDSSKKRIEEHISHIGGRDSVGKSSINQIHNHTEHRGCQVKKGSFFNIRCKQCHLPPFLHSDDRRLVDLPQNR